MDVNDLVREFTARNYTWRINGEDVVPSAEDFRVTLDRAKTMLYTEPVPSQIEVGRLMIVRWDENNFDIYLQIGQENDD